MKTPSPTMLTSWSHSKLGDFEKCRLLAKLKHLDKIPEPERPLPAGKTEHANDRGSRIHDNCELYVSGQSDDLAPEAEKFFGPQLDLMRILYAEGLVSLEGEWAMNEDWEIADWKEGWLRLKLDSIVFVDPTHAIVIDYKTGRKFGNEAKHAEQLQLYQLVAFLRYPQLEKITAELWYLDQPDGQNITSQTFTRKQGLLFKNSFHRRGMALVTNDVWPPNPNVHTCRWCMYGPWGSADCTVGVQMPKAPPKGRK